MMSLAPPFAACVSKALTHPDDGASCADFQLGLRPPGVLKGRGEVDLGLEPPMTLQAALLSAPALQQQAVGVLRDMQCMLHTLAWGLAIREIHSWRCRGSGSMTCFRA